MKFVTTTALALLAATAVSIPARADVKAGVDAWAQGDYTKAVKEWRALAQAGDADAQFNLGQAYKLGRGVPADLAQAMSWYGKAAAQGHARAEDNYGLLLFQQNRREESMPYLARSAERGDARAQYIVATALFNGDLLSRDWVRAYALMSRASASGLPQATASLVHMDRYIPEGQRADGLALAAAMTERAQEQSVLASAAKPATAPPAPARPTPKALREAPLPPSRPAAAPPVQAASKPPPKPAATGKWRVQLGAFSKSANAETMWKTMSAKVRGLSGYQHYLVPTGGITRLQAGPLASKADADALCATIKESGSDCIVKTM